MDVAASEFYNNKDKTYDLNFKEEVDILQNFSHFFLNFHFPVIKEEVVKCFS